MSTLPPLCRYCGKAIAKHTTTVRFGCSEADKARDSGWCVHRSERPTSKAEAQQLVNQNVVAVRWSRSPDYYADAAGFDHIYEASVWDGETYRDRYFCNGDHARSFAYAAVQPSVPGSSGLGLPDYWAAIEKQKERTP